MKIKTGSCFLCEHFHTRRKTLRSIENSGSPGARPFPRILGSPPSDVGAAARTCADGQPLARHFVDLYPPETSLNYGNMDKLSEYIYRLLMY